MRRSRWTRIKGSHAYRALDRALSPLNWKKRQRMKKHVQASLSEAEHVEQILSFFQRELFRSLGNLARPAQEQIAYLQHIFRFMNMKQEDEWISPDELALEYYEAFLGICGDPAKGIHGWGARLGITQVQTDALIRLDAKIGLMSGEVNAELWTGLALKQSPHWQEVRDLAQECLALLEGPQWSSLAKRGFALSEE